MIDKQKITLLTPHQYIDIKNDYVRLKQPLGLALLKSNSHTPITIIDSFAEGYEQRSQKNNILRVGLSTKDLISKIKETNPTIVGISNLWSSNYPAVEEMVNAVKTELPELKIILGGVHPSFEYKSILEKGTVDFVAIREATESLPQLINYLNGKISWSEVKGIARKENGIIKTPIPPRSIDLKKLNPIDYKDFPVKLYGKQKKFGLEESVLNADFVSSLGCPHRCDYCSTKQMWPGKYRTYSEKQLNFMFDSMIEAGYNFVSLQDDNLAANPRNAKLVMNKLKERNLSWHWEGGIEIGFLPYVLDELCDSSCTMVDMAIETAIKTNEGIYDKFKPKTEELLYKELTQMKKSGIFINSNFMLGIPGESKEDTLRTIEYAKKLKQENLIDHANFHLTMAYPGTKLSLQDYERPVGNKPQDYFGYAATIGNIPHKDYSREELIILRNKADIYVNGQELFDKKRAELNRY